MKRRLKNNIIIIPLFLPLSYSSDYIFQTVRILKKNNLVIYMNLYDYETVSWNDIIKRRKDYVVTLFNYLFVKKRGSILFRPISLFPFQRFSFISAVNHSQVLGIFQLRLILYFLKRKTLVWGFNPKMNVFLKAFGTKILSLYDCVDHLGNDIYTREFTSFESALFRKVDLIVFNSKYLYLTKKRDFNFMQPSIYVPCGCDFRLFQKKLNTVPTQLPKNELPIVICCGLFNFRIDVKLLEYIISHNQHFLFLFIGQTEKNLNPRFYRLLAYKNVVYIKNIDKNKLPYYYHLSSVGIVPYRTQFDFARFSNPMKAYEYLASGLPVVSTKILALDKYSKDIVYTTNSSQEFSSALRRFIKNWDNKARFKAMKIAKLNSWENKIKAIEGFIIKRTYEKN